MRCERLENSIVIQAPQRCEGNCSSCERQGYAHILLSGRGLFNINKSGWCSSRNFILGQTYGAAKHYADFYKFLNMMPKKVVVLIINT